MDNTEELPIRIESNNLYSILKVSAIHSILAGDRLLIEMTIPIVKTNNYKLIQTIPLPIYTNQSLKIIIPSSNMFLTNLEINQYIPLTVNEYQDCRSTDEHKAIYKQNESIIQGVDIVAELQILKTPSITEIPAQCRTNTKNQSVHKWIQSTKYAK